ncbi:protein mono-ADP-ribosyltransferase PARP6-like isoform X2 [Periophthalmus magnuspinnatus]|uniref:protein mono-ADP-ribosyltransferase PARP6-like isoform X2 n=1 Tax=Periophthalmus magnuspinnatus TaxID=409849 RepID=UPI002436562C|nr:protein mono-ADP-ribosyltransferase PARP6-like isoform X2 [Periophthalmus magnuspinnatus]
MMKTLKVSMETGRKQRAGYHISNNRHSAIHLCQNEIRATDLLRHPQLQADIEAFKTHYSKSAVSVREYMTIDEVDIDLIIKSDFLNALVTKAWKINSSEPIIIRLHFSLSQYLDGPAPTVEVLQSSNRHTFCIGKQLQNILTAFINNEWRNLTNEKVICHQKRRNSWFRPAGTIKKFRARFNIWLPSSKSNEPLESNGRSRIILPTVNLNRFSNTTASYAIKNPTGELFAYTPSGKRVAVSAVKSSTELSTKQLIELLFSTQAIRHCKAAPTLQHGFLVQIMKYAEQRLLTLNEYCVICDERHVFQNGPLLKPAVCTRELCVFSFYTLGVMSEVTEEVATGAEVIDLLVAMCRAALQSKRKSIIFEPYPSIVDPCNPKTLAFTHKQLKFMHTPHQFLLICSPPYKEVRFQMARKLYGSTFAFHGSHIENWHSILRNGLVNASFTKLQLHGAAYGKGIYLSPNSGMSFGYSEMGYGQHHLPSKEELKKKYNRINRLTEEPAQARFLKSKNINCIALCEVILSKELQQHGNIWVCPVPDHVCTRFLFVYENGQVGDVHINTQDNEIRNEILQAISTEPF